MCGQLRKTCVFPDSVPHRINPTGQLESILIRTQMLRTTPLVVEKDGINYASQAHNLKVIKVMGCKEEYESIVQ